MTSCSAASASVSSSRRVSSVISLIDRVAEMVLRFHQRRARDHGVPREVGRAESSEPFGKMSRWALDRLLELFAALPVARQGTVAAQAVDGFLVGVTRLPRTQVRKALNASSHAKRQSSSRAATKPPRSRELGPIDCRCCVLRAKPMALELRTSEPGTRNPELRTKNSEPNREHEPRTENREV